MFSIEERVIEVVKSQLGLDLDNNGDVVVGHSNLRDDLGADSLDMEELVDELQCEFDIELEDDALSELYTIQDIIDFISGFMSVTK